MKSICLLLFGLFLTTQVHGQLHFNATQGALAGSMAGTGVHLEGIDGIFNNQAGLADINSFGFILGSEVRFLVDELAAVGVGVAFPIQDIGTIGISASNLGFDAYKEQKLGVAYARKLAGNINIGVQFDFLNTTIAGFGNKQLVTAEVGIQTKIGKQYGLSAHIFSPAKISLLDEFNDVNSRIRIGGYYQPSKNIIVAIEIEKWLQNPLSVHGGLDYTISDQFSFRVGASSNPSLFTLGVGYRFGTSVAIDGGYSYFTELGSTPSFTIKTQ